MTPTTMYYFPTGKTNTHTKTTNQRTQIYKSWKKIVEKLVYKKKRSRKTYFDILNYRVSNSFSLQLDHSSDDQNDMPAWKPNCTIRKTLIRVTPVDTRRVRTGCLCAAISTTGMNRCCRKTTEIAGRMISPNWTNTSWSITNATKKKEK